MMNSEKYGETRELSDKKYATSFQIILLEKE